MFPRALEEKEHEGRHIGNTGCPKKGLRPRFMLNQSWRRCPAKFLGRRGNLRSHKCLALLAEMIILCKQDVLSC